MQDHTIMEVQQGPSLNLGGFQLDATRSIPDSIPDSIPEWIEQSILPHATDSRKPLLDIYSEILTLRREVQFMTTHVTAVSDKIDYLIAEEHRRFMLPHRRLIRLVYNLFSPFRRV